MTALTGDDWLRGEETIMKKGARPTMAGFLDKIEMRGVREGELKGKAEGMLLAFVQTVKGMITAFHIDTHKAMDIAGVPEEYRAQVLAAL